MHDMGVKVRHYVGQAASPVSCLEGDGDTIGALPWLQQLDPEPPIWQLLGHESEETNQVDNSKDEPCPL